MRPTRIALALVLLATTASAANLRPLILTNGMGTFPCDGQAHWSAVTPIHANVKRAYLYFSMSNSTVNGADVMLGDPALYDNPIAQIHKLSPNGQGWIEGNPFSGEDNEVFSPDVVWADELGAVAICWGGGQGLMFANVWLADQN